MSDYNHLFDFGAYGPGLDAVDSVYPALPSDLAQSGASTAPLPLSVGLIGGDTAAQLQAGVDSASLVSAERLG